MLATVSLLVDRVVGDPRILPHPVVLMGNVTRFMERRLNKWQSDRARALQMKGVLLTLMVTGGSFVITSWTCMIAAAVSPLLGIFVNIWLISTTIAWKGLNRAGREVYTALTTRDLDAGRKAVSMIVGRDSAQMNESEVVRATVETLAENVVDAIVSPVFFAMLGGAPLAMAYRAVNTLDSMVGYKNDRYRAFGWASARLDDVLNYLPARATVLLLYFALLRDRRSANSAWRVMCRDARKHPSPNSGFPESMVAGGLSIQLGGLNYYDGVPSHRAQMGDPFRSLTPERILETVRLVAKTGWLLFSVAGLITLLVAGYLNRT
ncbi:adenosylcobinamide-phosphate synthase [Ferroacidibacillus organovorans]|uniref:Cobalamin biosynthesis protein CobD n=1 Tax=Ferroacidibacillus organovorans TaxID=1765683 RepID=A0A162T244_9BACL|nr:adenosylcobinamide-phosphate synthase [Ferroacidibacillus organovorans]OAG93332.1 adenosylcobinamide-phosphate synthase [Ferroacidibacillus organovorans]OPG16648.1 cobalamin biosynthesis protein CobD [Ferroacidibacillus organovorans]